MKKKELIETISVETVCESDYQLPSRKRIEKEIETTEIEEEMIFETFDETFDYLSVQKHDYKQIETTKEITMSGNKSIMYPVATLVDGYGGVCQIINDDHCYVLCLKRKDGTYKNATHIFNEAFEVLKTLPSPN
jgi:glucose-6-phosphate 1-dehydrogenase